MNIRDQAKQHIKPFFADTRFTYHSWDHTLTVVDNVRQIASMEGVSDQEMEILELAAYFHDSGYQQGSEGHEARGARIAREFLTSKDFPQSRITLVEELIRVTQMEVEATNQLEFIIKDADVAHIASADYLIYGDRLRQEEETIHSTTHTDLEWAKYNRQFIKNYKWKSKSGKKLFREGQKENVAELKEIIKELQLEADQKNHISNPQVFVFLGQHTAKKIEVFRQRAIKQLLIFH
ncbi:MAG: HD domain-containing protein [Bacteroidota bacterium]